MNMEGVERPDDWSGGGGGGGGMWLAEPLWREC